MPRICILICTCNRPELLRKLLTALTPQAHAWDATVVLVDNGTHSAEAVAAAFQSGLKLTYHRVSEPGLVTARNTSLRNAMPLKPDYLVFVDDDEVPEADWLSNLIASLEQSGCDFATGPVLPDYAMTPPPWASQGEFFHADADSLRTSNLILRASIVPPDEAEWFHPDFNFTGGEDSEFLSRLIAAGAKHGLAENAPVREFVPPDRLKRRYIWRRGMRDGVAIALILKLRNPQVLAFASRAAWRALQKTGYGLNHLFWSLQKPWRFNCAMADFSAATGILACALGAPLSFYATQSKRHS